MLSQRASGRNGSTVTRRKFCAGAAAAALVPASAASAAASVVPAPSRPPVPAEMLRRLPPDQAGDQYVSISREVETGVRGPFSARALMYGPDEFPDLRACLELQRRFPERVDIALCRDTPGSYLIHCTRTNTWLFTYPMTDIALMGWQSLEEVPAHLKLKRLGKEAGRG